jgi:lysyl-tRNA synthetase class 2
MTHLVEPSFEHEKLTFVYDYPASQASLARVRQDKTPVAERFELYWHGVELANGFTELLDADEQRKRFELDNEKRQRSGRNPIAIDENFLASLQRGMPACSGVALGLDRLLMVISQTDALEKVMPFPVTAV